jgi:Ca2+:H+ antiporter
VGRNIPLPLAKQPPFKYVPVLPELLFFYFLPLHTFCLPPPSRQTFQLSMGRFGLTSIADRIRSGARAHAVGRESPRNNSSVPPASSLSDDQPTALEAQNVDEKRSTNKRSRRNQNNNNRDVNNKSEKPQVSPPLERTSSTSNSQAHGSGDPPSLDEPQPPDIVPKRSIPTRIREGCIRFWRHTKNAILRSYINILLVFVPIGIAAEFAHLRPEIVFAMNAIAIIPLAGLLTHATESVAVRLGDTLGALLNVSFGNAVELIIL